MYPLKILLKDSRLETVHHKIFMEIPPLEFQQPINISS